MVWSRHSHLPNRLNVSPRPERTIRQKAKGPIDPSQGEIVRRLRIERDMTQADLAGDDFSKGFISLVENGRTRMSVRAIQVFAKRLGVTPATIIGEDPRYGRFVDQLRAAEKVMALSRRFLDEHEPLVKDALRRYERWADGQRKLSRDV